MLEFRPAIYQGGELYELPRPVRSVRLQEGWDFEQFKVPLRDGDQVTGHSQRGVEILLEGEVDSQGGKLKVSEVDMLETILSLRGLLDVDGESSKYSLVLYRDVETDGYRRFKKCSTVEFEYDLSRPQLFTYSLIVHAEDPVIYLTDPADD
ncbi:hypothetical protein Pla110_06880 [Polystyrenella longa]|uniref:Uncharacterized protein n=1 Tax=Polystyrenella longa TaxID=2528007 RepID=A0A518CII0_9PLAN|nr:hypothetical protein [Polystyrenella longa]QDU78984.1 hypothetical protein Pla110_06880 [Polystyrenella longa]